MSALAACVAAIVNNVRCSRQFREYHQVLLALMFIDWLAGRRSDIQRVLLMPTCHKSTVDPAEPNSVLRGFAGLTVAFAIDAAGRIDGLTWILNRRLLRAGFEASFEPAMKELRGYDIFEVL